MVGEFKGRDAAKLVERIRQVGRRLTSAQPREVVVGNIVRRVLGLVREVVDENGCAIPYVSDQHHGRVLPVVDLCGAALLVNQGKRHAESVGDGGCALRPSSIRGDYNSLLVVGDVELDVFAEEVTAIEVVHGDIEEALVLWI